MSIILAGDISQGMFTTPNPFFSSSGVPPLGKSTFSAQAQVPVQADEQCPPMSETPFADGRFQALSGCSPSNFADGRFQTLTDDPVVLPPDDPGPFSIYKSPTAEGFNNISKDFYTYDALHFGQSVRAGVRMVIYKLDRKRTDIDTLLGEATANEYFKKGIVTLGIPEVNQIMLELAKWGVDETQEFILHFNLTHLFQRLGRPILPGDIIGIYLTSTRLTQATLNADQHNRDWEARHTRVLTRVNTAIPDKLFLYNYMELQVQVAKIRFDVEVIDDLEDVYELDQAPPDNEDDIPNFPFTKV